MSFPTAASRYDLCEPKKPRSYAGHCAWMRGSTVQRFVQRWLAVTVPPKRNSATLAKLFGFRWITEAL
jgi:hypothetical protein